MSDNCIQEVLLHRPGQAGICKSSLVGLDASDVNKLDWFLNRCKRLNYCNQTIPCITTQFDEADESLFQTVISDGHHVLHHRLPAMKSLKYKLGPWSHSFTLTCKNFIPRMLFRDAYLHECCFIHYCFNCICFVLFSAVCHCSVKPVWWWWWCYRSVSVWLSLISKDDGLLRLVGFHILLYTKRKLQIIWWNLTERYERTRRVIKLPLIEFLALVLIFNLICANQSSEYYFCVGVSEHRQQVQSFTSSISRITACQCSLCRQSAVQQSGEPVLSRQCTVHSFTERRAEVRMLLTMYRTYSSYGTVIR